MTGRCRSCIFVQPDSGRSRFVAHLSFLGLMTMKLLVLLSKISQQENPGTQWWLEDYSFPFGMCFFRGYARFRNLSLGTAWICILVHSLIFFSIKPTQKYVQSKSNLICISFQFYTLYRNFVVCVPSIFRAIFSKNTLLYFI